MKRLIVALLVVWCVATAWAAVHPITGVELTTPLQNLTQRELFLTVFEVQPAALDSAKVWYASHAGMDASAVTDSVLIEEIVATGRSRLRSLEEQYLAKQTPAAATF